MKACSNLKTIRLVGGPNCASDFFAERIGCVNVEFIGELSYDYVDNITLFFSSELDVTH